MLLGAVLLDAEIVLQIVGAAWVPMNEDAGVCYRRPLRIAHRARYVYYIILSYELAPGCFTRSGEGLIEIGCGAD